MRQRMPRYDSTRKSVRSELDGGGGAPGGGGGGGVYVPPGGGVGGGTEGGGISLISSPSRSSIGSRDCSYFSLRASRRSAATRGNTIRTNDRVTAVTTGAIAANGS